MYSFSEIRESLDGVELYILLKNMKFCLSEKSNKAKKTRKQGGMERKEAMRCAESSS